MFTTQMRIVPRNMYQICSGTKSISTNILHYLNLEIYTNPTKKNMKNQNRYINDFAEFAS